MLSYLRAVFLANHVRMLVGTELVRNTLAALHLDTADVAIRLVGNDPVALLDDILAGEHRITAVSE